MYNSRLGRRTKRISDSKLAPKLRDRRIIDEDDDDDDTVEIGDVKLTPEEIQGLLELLPYKEALIKIAKGEFEIEKVEEAEEDTEGEGDEAGAEDDLDNFEEDENLAGDENSDSENEDEDEDYEDFEEDEEDDTVGDSAVNDAWKKRLAGNNK